MTEIKTQIKINEVEGVEIAPMPEAIKVEVEKKIVLPGKEIKEEKVEMAETPAEISADKKEPTISPNVELDIAQFAQDIKKFGETEQYAQVVEELRAGQEFIKKHPLET